MIDIVAGLWYNELNDHLKGCVNEYFGITSNDEAHLKIVEGTLKTVPDMCIIPLQDYLGLLDSEGRMNIPSTLGCNWRWRCLRTDYNASLAKYIKKITKESNRL